MRDEHILAALFGQPWAIDQVKFLALREIALRHLRAERLPRAAIEAITAAAQRPPVPNGGGVAVIPVVGVIAQRASMMTEMSGGVSTQRLAQQLRAALGDPAVGSIVLDIDSPGGSVYGTPEIAEEIFRSRGSKPIVAVANSMAASAAYWIATAADELVVTPSGEVGSIGVIAMHEDWSRAYDSNGVTPTLITAGKYKAELTDTQPLTSEAVAYMQARVNAYYDDFVKAVARGRGVTSAEVRAGFGQARMVGAKDAVNFGMADRIATLDETVARLARSGVRRSGGARAEDEQPTYTYSALVTRITTTSGTSGAYVGPPRDEGATSLPDAEIDTDLVAREERHRQRAAVA